MHFVMDFTAHFLYTVIHHTFEQDDNIPVKTLFVCQVILPHAQTGWLAGWHRHLKQRHVLPDGLGSNELFNKQSPI
jgi:hypothetical protein